MKASARIPSGNRLISRYGCSSASVHALAACFVAPASFFEMSSTAKHTSHIERG